MNWSNKENLDLYRDSILRPIHLYLEGLVGEQWERLIIALIGFILMLLVFLILDSVLKKILLFITRKIIDVSRGKWSKTLFNRKVFNSVYHLVTVAIVRALTPYYFLNLSDYQKIVDKFFYIVFTVIILQLFFRLSNAISDISTDENNYRTVAVRTFGQLTKIISTFFAVIAIVSILFDIGIEKVLTTLGALTAILILVFRDTILGFVSGVQISSTRMIKVGDWVSIPKYELEGTVQEVNLVSVKILNFDKTISSIPTYDLISTEVKNYEPMIEINARRIKRSILFNIKSFNFCTDKMLEKYKEIDLIRDYIIQKEKEITQEAASKKEGDISSVNIERLTNIGVFRTYTEAYLRSNKLISRRRTDTLMVRQLESTPQGLPLEIYCFTTTSKWLDYEKIQSDIFDHLLTICKEFDLEVVQILSA